MRHTPPTAGRHLGYVMLPPASHAAVHTAWMSTCVHDRPCVLAVVYNPDAHHAALADLVFLWKQGYNYRLPEAPHQLVNPAVVQQLVQSVEEAVAAYAQRCPAHPFMLQWRQAVMVRVTQQAQALPAGIPVMDLTPNISTWPPVDINEDDVHQFLQALHEVLVITRVDKTGKSFAAMCLAMFVSQLREQMGTACFQVLQQPRSNWWKQLRLLCLLSMNTWDNSRDNLHWPRPTCW